MRKKTKPKSPFTGRWRTTWMEQWDQDFVDAEVEGFFEFRKDGSGEFQFGYVRGEIDYRSCTRDGKPSVEFTWGGHDEMDSAQGRGWAVIDHDEIMGTIFFHQGNESEFKAKKQRK